MPMSKETAIIILNYNDCEETKEYVEDLKKFPILNHILVVDNQSEDDSYEILNRNFHEIPNIDIIQTPKNLGYARGNNWGFQFLIKKYPRCEFVFFSNSDVQITNQALASLLCIYKELLNMGKSVGIVAPVVENEDVYPIKLPQYSQDIKSMLLPLGLWKNKALEGNEYYLKGEVLLKTEVVFGAFFLLSSEVFKKIGGFDEQTFLYGEERILAFKLKGKYDNYLVKSIKFSHVSSAVINSNVGLQMKYSYLYASRRIYWDKYVGVSIVKLKFYDLISSLSMIEIRFLGLIKKGILLWRKS